MQNFIVLGLVPGTHLQITFLIWTFMAAGLLVLTGVWILRRRHVVRRWVLATVTYWTIRRSHPA